MTENIYNAIDELNTSGTTHEVFSECCEAAERNGLQDNELAYLVCYELVKHFENLDTELAINLASYSLECISRDDPKRWLCHALADILQGVRVNPAL